MAHIMAQETLKSRLLICSAQQTNEVLIASLVLMAVNGVIFWQSIPHCFISIWSGCLFVTCLIRGYGAHIYLRTPELQPIAKWNVQMISTSILQGIAWGVFSVVAYRYLSLGDMIIVMMTIAGMTAGAVTSTSSSFISFLGFSVTALLPLALVMLSASDKESKAIGLLLNLFFLLTLRQARTMNKILVTSIGNSIELERAKLRSESIAKELYQLSTMDSLTLISNRRGFDEALSREWQRSRRTESALTLILLDVDNFKAYNDHFGHPAGDKCLRDIALELTHHARRGGDIVSRYGGEEFAIILPDLNNGLGIDIANNICSAVEKLKLEHPISDCSDVVTISAGVHSTIPGRFQDSQELIKCADLRSIVLRHTGATEQHCLWRQIH